MHGGEIGKFNSEYEEQFHKNMFELRLPFWIGYHGHKYHGTKFVWSDGSADLYNKLNGESLRLGLSAGLCTLVTKSALWNRAHCNETHAVLCRKPGKPVIYLPDLICYVKGWNIGTAGKGGYGAWLYNYLRCTGLFLHYQKMSKF